jgi:hypothetical protein
VFAWSYEEIPGIDLRIVEHEITTYLDAKTKWQKLHLINPKKATTIKAEVEKMFNVGFIYHVQLTQCIDFRDLNKACPKDNFPMLFIDQIVDECVGCEAFYFIYGFLGYNQIKIKLEDQHKISFICSWGTFSYRKIPFGLKNAGATFQWAMSFSYHDLKHVVEDYLDLASSESTIGMVLVQEDDFLSEYMIYYLSRGLVGPELNYSHVEKIALATVHAVQRFCHYILFHKTTIIVIVNPFQYVLTRCVIGRKISRWIAILQ